MKENILFFDLVMSGHHLEYFYHIAENIKIDPERHVYFLVNNGFTKEYNDMFRSTIHQDIKVIEINEFESEKLASKKGLFKYLYTGTILLKYIKSINKPLQCVLMDIYPMLLTLCLKKYNVSFSGIYFIPIAKKHTSFVDIVKKSILRIALKRNVWNKIYVLNNKNICDDLNVLYKTDLLFQSIPDPILNLNIFSSDNSEFVVRNDNPEALTFLHIGMISERKGTSEIIKALGLLEEKVIQKIKIIIAGKIDPLYRDVFYNLINDFNFNDSLEICEKSLSYMEFYEFFKRTDYLIIPYKFTNMSSGILSHSINMDKPVIGPKSGLLGGLITQYKLGMSINTDPKSIAESIEFLVNNRIEIDKVGQNDFLKLCSPTEFTDIISLSTFDNRYICKKTKVRYR